ncbi:MAG TPA: hypothetical protein VE134_01100 [Methanomicrobiales archaeon]|nr:hypothetical protein [Methanomicrobiales archaeon]
MQILDRLMKLFIASMFAGALMRFAVPQDLDVVSITLDFLYNVIYQGYVGLSPGISIPEDFTSSLMILPIALIPLLYAIITGKWSILTYILGFPAGYLLADFLRVESFFSLLIGIFIVLIGFFEVLYVRSVKVRRVVKDRPIFDAGKRDI